MNWDQLLSATRFGQENLNLRPHARTEFQRDYDRLIFSPSFRRLQNKTQVFPLPGAIFVHNRLTHSLEVASVGRSLANNVSIELLEKYKGEEWTDKLQSLDDIVATACLAHDMGNPPFGHSGERAIISYFKEGEGQRFLDVVSPHQWADLTHFDGNANAFRLLTHHFNGRRKGGFVMTYSTLASIVKYPFSSDLAGEKHKFGFFRSEVEDYCRIADELGILKLDAPEGSYRYARYPLVYLVEAADDICYQVMDIEDSHKLKLLTTDQVKNLFLNYFEGEKRNHIAERMATLEDINEQIVYLRSCVINCLEQECVRVFVEHEEEFLAGTFPGPLIKYIAEVPRKAYQECEKMAYSNIYHCKDVVDIEIAGYKVMTQLTDLMIKAVTHPEKAFSKLLINRVSPQYQILAPTLYERVMAVLDYISGMTDVFALDLYRKINGMSLPDV